MFIAVTSVLGDVSRQYKADDKLNDAMHYHYLCVRYKALITSLFSVKKTDKPCEYAVIQSL